MTPTIFKCVNLYLKLITNYLHGNNFFNCKLRKYKEKIRALHVPSNTDKYSKRKLSKRNQKVEHTE